MTTADRDRELDTRLAAAAGVHDEGLPALPLSFLRDLVNAPHDPASVVAARQLADDAHRDRTARRSTSRRRAVRRPVVLLVAAAVGVAALVVATDRQDTDVTVDPIRPSTTGSTPTGPPDDLGPLDAPPGGLALAGTTALSFPYSLTSTPAGLTPVVSYTDALTLFGYTSPASWRAQYRSAQDIGFTFQVSTTDPRVLPPGASESLDARTEASTVQVAGVPGDLLIGDYDSPSCRDAPSTPDQTTAPVELCADSFAQLTWQRPDGMWVQVFGEDDWSTGEAVVAVGGSIVDEPQAVPLQVRLAPAGWTVSGYEDNTSLTLVSDTDPSLDNRISVGIQARWRGYTEPDLQGYVQDDPIESTTVNGQPGELASIPSGSPESAPGTRMWVLEYALPGGLVVFLTAPDSLTHDQVLQIAAQVVYSS